MLCKIWKPKNQNKTANAFLKALGFQIFWIWESYVPLSSSSVPVDLDDILWYPGITRAGFFSSLYELIFTLICVHTGQDPLVKQLEAWKKGISGLCHIWSNLQVFCGLRDGGVLSQSCKFGCWCSLFNLQHPPTWRRWWGRSVSESECAAGYCF